MKLRAFLADGVQASEGKLYVLGAGWNRLVFREPGTYAFELRIDEGEPERLRFKVDLAANPGEAGPASGGATSARMATEAGYL